MNISEITLNKYDMEKEYVIDFEAIGCTDDTLQGVFNEKTVIKEVEEFLKERYGDRLKWFVISENSVNGLEEIYDSRNRNKYGLL